MIRINLTSSVCEICRSDHCAMQHFTLEKPCLLKHSIRGSMGSLPREYLFGWFVKNSENWNFFKNLKFVSFQIFEKIDLMISINRLNRLNRKKSKNRLNRFIGQRINNYIPIFGGKKKYGKKCENERGERQGRKVVSCRTCNKNMPIIGSGDSRCAHAPGSAS